MDFYGSIIYNRDLSECKFLHIPRTGGRSLQASITESNFDFQTHKHNLREGYVHLKDAEYEYVFTILRNPYERVLSSYYFLKNGGLGPVDEKDAEVFVNRYGNFDCFVKDGLENAKNNQIHFYSQSFWLKDDDGLFIPDLVWNTERLNEGWSKFSELLGNENDIRKWCNDNTNKNSWEDVYTKESLVRVSNLYGEDLELFEDLILQREGEFYYSKKHDCHVL